MAIDPVILALEEQLGCYQRLAKLAEAQHEHVKQGQTDALLTVLTRRETVLEELKRLEQVIAPAKRQWTEYVNKLDVTSRVKAEGLLASTRELLERITAADRDDVMVLQHRKHNIGQQIGQTKSARQVNRTYAAAAYGTRPPQMDLKR
jgi:hypothetical protein